MNYDIYHEFVSISSQTAKHRIVLIHGWGADSEDLLPLGKEIMEKSKIDFEVISLRAPSLHPNNIGRQWYGLYPPDWKSAEDEAKKLSITLKKLDKYKIPLKKTILLGFSQGGAMAIDAGSELDLGLVVSCSGYPHPKWKPERNFPPVIIIHGLMDDIVPFSASKTLYQKIKKISKNICELYEFGGYHHLDPNLINILNLKINELF